MYTFKTTKLDEKAKLEKKGWKCKEEIVKDKPVVFVFELDEDVIIEDFLAMDTEKAAPSKAKVEKPKKGKKNGKK